MPPSTFLLRTLIYVVATASLVEPTTIYLTEFTLLKPPTYDVAALRHIVQDLIVYYNMTYTNISFS